MKIFWIRRVAAFILFAAAGILIFGSAVMFLWNALLPQLFHLQTITFAQALGLLVLSKILFGGFRGGFGRGQQWKNKMREKWGNMTPEEKDKLKQEWKNRCGRRPWDDKPAQ